MEGNCYGPCNSPGGNLLIGAGRPRLGAKKQLSNSPRNPAWIWAGPRLLRQKEGTQGRDLDMKRPYNVPGFGWILAAIALVVAVLGLVGVTIPVLSTTYVLIILLALALLL